MVLLALAALLAGCAGDGPPEGGGGPPQQSEFDEIQAEVFDQSCVSGACHDSGTRAGDLSLAAGESFGELVDVEPDNAAARDAGLLRVEPFSVEGSFLVDKLRGTLSGGEGAQMPIGAPPVPEEQIARIEAWIAAGASPTEPPPGGGGDQPAPSYADVQRQVFDATCVSASCHDDGTRAGGLSLASGSSYDEIVGVAPTTASAAADGLLRVAPGDPARSFVLNKLTGELAPGDGARMPLAASPLATDTITLFRDWIAAGASQD